MARALGWLARGDRALNRGSTGGRRRRSPTSRSLPRWWGCLPPDLADHVLIVEEVSEAMYAIDRMLFTLGNATQLRSLAGVRLGAVTDVQANEPEWGEGLDAMMTRWCRDLGVPYLGLGRGWHTQTNRVVPFGIA
ncbi:hypothetical protein AB5I41_19490 [Sphingomonas sp. MMS24-JH45]